MSGRLLCQPRKPPERTQRRVIIAFGIIQVYVLSSIINTEQNTNHIALSQSTDDVPPSSLPILSSAPSPTDVSNTFDDFFSRWQNWISYEDYVDGPCV